MSALSERPVPADAVVMGEIALSGEVRPVAHGALRLKEAAKLGFERGWIPASLDAATTHGDDAVSPSWASWSTWCWGGRDWRSAADLASRGT